ncbi:MAG TPA: hypothetical protein VM031_01150, partial [Phycisphaerae bacterium]|nr:hypothetical protein [Phycisphaerae bacterium]
MSKSPKALDTLDETKVRLAGSAASLLALLGTAAAVIGLIAHLTGADVRSDVVLYLLLLTAFAGAGVIAGIQLLRGRQSAQQFLLVYWLCVMVAAAVMTLGVILWKVPEPWAKAISPNATPAGLAGWVSLLGVVLLVLGGGAVGLLAATTAPGSRQRYASMVLVSVGVALALVVAINLIGQYESPNTGRKNFVHVSMETLGRYGLSDRTKNVLRDVQKRVGLTCVYTSTDEAKRTDELRPRVLELLEDMKLYGKDVTVTNVTSDSGKAKLLDRLRGQLGSQAEKHDKFLRGFQKDSDALLGLLAEQQKKWQGQAPDSYLNLWGLAAEIAHVLEDGGERITRAREKLDAALKGGGLPDYDALSRDIQDAVKNVRENLEKGGELIGQIAKISAAAADPKKQEAAKKAIADCAAAAEAMGQNIGAPGSAVPDPPGDVLSKHVAASRKAAELALAVAKELDGLAGEDNAQLLRQSEPFMVPLQAGGPMPVSVALSDFYRLIAQRILEAASEAEAIVKNAKADYQKKFIPQVRDETRGVVMLAGQARQAAEVALKALATVDAASKAELEAAANNKLFGELVGKLKATVDAIEKLPKLEDTSLSRDISGDNIVIVEVGEKAEVVDFDEVWPLQNGMGMPRGDQPEKRAFNGDAAIGSKVLKMTEKPFATVLL